MSGSQLPMAESAKVVPLVALGVIDTARHELKTAAELNKIMETI